MIGCSRGNCIEIDLPDEPQTYTNISYELVHCQLRLFQFQSVRSTIEQNALLTKIQKDKEEKLAKKQKELEEMKINNPEIDVDEFLSKSKI